VITLQLSEKKKNEPIPIPTTIFCVDFHAPKIWTIWPIKLKRFSVYPKVLQILYKGKCKKSIVKTDEETENSGKAQFFPLWSSGS